MGEPRGRSERDRTSQHGFERDDIKSHPQGEHRGLTKLVKITEDMRKYAAEQSLTEEDAVKHGLEEKAAEFLEKGAEVYAKV
jgi:hypothetical protein